VGRVPDTGRRVVAVIGPHEVTNELYELAREVARLVCVEFNAAVICGGLGGVMQAASQGVRSANGVCVGILPGRNPRQGDPLLTVAVATGLGEQRNQVIVDGCDVLISVGENAGTLDEIGRARRAGRLVVSIQGAGEPARADTRHRVFVRTAAAAIDRVAESCGWFS
jgi:uncharacterized protein (TIGR00725 family)